MKKHILFITPPFTQLNTPYPATAYLKGFLNTLQIPSTQADLGIEVILKLFTADNLTLIFDQAKASTLEISDNSQRILALEQEYLSTINPVISFLQNRDTTLAHNICGRNYLPEASRFENLEDLDWAFGSMGIQDKARHLATLYLEDIGDMIKEIIDPYFGFSRYAERISSTASNFDQLHEALNEPNSHITNTLHQLLESKISSSQAAIVCLSVPFPGNLFAALKCGQYLKAHHPEISIVLGGGYANTELRRIADERVFKYLDFICLDDGETPLLHLIEHLNGERPIQQLKRTFACTNGVVCYYNGSKSLDTPQREIGTPDYEGLPIQDYLSVIEIANPMHRLWSDGRWNKLTLAHGCYWGKCSFCDVSLDYIQRYEPVTAALLCDRIETIIAQTQQRGFHFVDEAAPPALMRDLALEIIRRKLTITWWTNIRFEKNFTADLCKLLKASGCIAVSGGLEVASDRLLDLMKKGVTVAQVAQVAHHFTTAGIMVHAYLMYGFPTQTAQETIDSLEIVRQLFQSGVVQSGFWHRFAMTAHSPVGLSPASYGVSETGPQFEGFADNDRWHDDPTGADHDLYGDGLKTSLFNYMHGICFEFPLSEWFEFETPIPTIAANYIESSLAISNTPAVPKGSARIVWHGPLPEGRLYEQENGAEIAELYFYNKQKDWLIETSPAIGQWLIDTLNMIHIESTSLSTFNSLKEDFEQQGLGSFESFYTGPIWKALKDNGLWVF